mmetsp:Transcript_88156/g.121620  ORF Transcript_88156/g.121620 Transcript_88156/m.121620 type:complete len:104 (-) Transcript_88156:1562-1873(-)
MPVLEPEFLSCVAAAVTANTTGGGRIDRLNLCPLYTQLNNFASEGGCLQGNLAGAAAKKNFASSSGRLHGSVGRKTQTRRRPLRAAPSSAAAPWPELGSAHNA